MAHKTPSSGDHREAACNATSEPRRSLFGLLISAGYLSDLLRYVARQQQQIRHNNNNNNNHSELLAGSAARSPSPPDPMQPVFLPLLPSDRLDLAERQNKLLSSLLTAFCAPDATSRLVTRGSNDDDDDERDDATTCCLSACVPASQPLLLVSLACLAAT